MKMTVGDKWSSLFHHVIQHEERMTPEVAADAIVLIRGLHGRWKKSLEAAGYESDADIEAETRLVFEALQARSAGNSECPEWPMETLLKWEMTKPFHHEAESLLSADWMGLKNLTLRTNVDQCSAVQENQLWIVSRCEAVLNAWQRVINALLPLVHAWSIETCYSIAELPVPAGIGATVLLLGSPWDVPAQTPLIDLYKQRLEHPEAVTVVATCEVAHVLKVLSTQGTKSPIYAGNSDEAMVGAEHV